MKEFIRRERLIQGISIGRAARILGVPTVTLRDWMNKDLVPGVRRTEGGHRWITRESLFAFARARGLGIRKKEEKRRHPRVQAHKVRLRVRVELPGFPTVEGEGRLRDLSRSGFRGDRLDWMAPLVPRKGTRILFMILGTQGRLGGITGTARLAWHIDNRRNRGATLGARIRSFGSEEARESWFAYVNEGLN